MASSVGLSLSEIKDLGGTKDDLELLRGVDEESVSELEFEEASCSKDAEYNEICSFIKSIGLKSCSEQQQLDAAPTVDRKERNDCTRRDRVTGKKRDTPMEAKLMTLAAIPYKKLLVPLDSDEPWFEQSNSEPSDAPVCQTTLDHLIAIGEKLVKVEIQLYQKDRQKSKGARDVLWLKTVLSSGTLGDKVAALTLLVQESPFHTLASLDGLLAMASKKGKRESILAIDTLKELWISELLPEDRKLKSMKQRPFRVLVEESADRLVYRKLVLWLFEDQVKARFAKFLSIVQSLSHDPVSNIREKMLGCVFDLLYRKPEQEQELLSQLVNKLGDPVKKVASKAGLFILKLVHHHINMKPVIAKELERFLHRPNVSSRSQYYAVCTLNQFVISDEALAQKLMAIYFTFFRVYTSNRELDAKMLAALLTGVNRAFPFVEGDIPSFEEHLQSLFKVVHVGPLATAIQSLVLLYQVMESRQAVSGRYYQALYTKLLEPQLRHSKKQAILLNLLFKSLKSDPEMKRVKAFLKRILQICAIHSPPFVCGCLFLISEVLKVRPNLWAFVLQSESEEDHYADVGSTRPPAGRGGSGYQITTRNPLYCRAEDSCLWELARLGSHYHPSVQVFAKKITEGVHIHYSGDPLEDFTLMRFLDRFVYKNPKQKINDHGGSLMQRTSKLLQVQSKEMTINSAQFAALSESKVREDELFMHKYFVDKASSEGSQAGKKKPARHEEKERASGSSEVDRVQDEMDFAGELERQKKVLSSHKKKKKKGKAETDSDQSGDDSDIISKGDMSVDDFDYGGESSGEESLLGPKGGDSSSQAQMEKLLLDNLSSSSEDEEIATKKQPKKKRRKGQREETGETFDSASMFAAAEEFAHLLEESGSGAKERCYPPHRRTKPPRTKTSRRKTVLHTY